jgi:hypothetical protein
MSVVWRRTELTADLLRCDLCGEEADTIHLHGVSACGMEMCRAARERGCHPEDAYLETNPVQAVFSCSAHDAGGEYGFSVARWFADDQPPFAEHLEEKLWCWHALCALQARFDTLLQEAARLDALPA